MKPAEIAGPQVEIEFDIIREVWSSYDLEDGTLLRCRSILLKVMGPKNLPPKGAEFPLGFSFHQINTVTAPPSLRGTPNPTPVPLPELQRLPSEEVDVATEHEAWNLYRIRRIPQVRGLKTKVVVTTVLKVPKQYDQEGNPQYIVNSTVLATPARPKDLLEP